METRGTPWYHVRPVFILNLAVLVLSVLIGIGLNIILDRLLISARRSGTSEGIYRFGTDRHIMDARKSGRGNE